jgi:SOS-response transcriptional repressor LexA
MSTPGSDFGPWLRRKLIERHLSLAQLARTVGCDYTYLWRIIHAENASGRKYFRPSYALTKRVGEALDAPREALAAAGYGDTPTMDEARSIDRLERLEKDLAALRSSLDPRNPGDPSSWKWVRLPLLGRIRAGELNEAIENPDETTYLPDWLAPGANYSLQVFGDSMSPTLVEGDVVCVKKQTTAEPGQLVVGGIDEDMTVKRYEIRDGVPVLAADNPEYPPVRCGPKVRLIGVVVGSFRPQEVLRKKP